MSLRLLYGLDTHERPPFHERTRDDVARVVCLHLECDESSYHQSRQPADDLRARIQQRARTLPYKPANLRADLIDLIGAAQQLIERMDREASNG